MECVEELGIKKDEKMESNTTIERSRSRIPPSTEKKSDSFDKALESVEEALVRLEKLMQELHLSSTSSGKEHLKAACSDLEKIRKLKKEAEFLEASFRAKAASLQQGDDTCNTVGEQTQYVRGRKRKDANVMASRSTRDIGKSRGFWRSFMPPVPGKVEPNLDINALENESIEQSTSNFGEVDMESCEIHRFELLRNELIKLERRVQRSAYQSEDEEDTETTDDSADYGDDIGGAQLVQVQRKGNIIEKSFGKLKETGTDVWQGTQLLAIDAAAAMELLRRSVLGDELTEKEKKALRRTLIDLASVVPIGILMLLPVTAVGHAAMLAAIQRYVPALIPSTYAPERLALLRQLEKMKEITSNEANSDEQVDETV
ncbi:LETM1-like protein [Quillaja saponaria]|uniref:LETM1-like protein n=1 Tax=Quillaja saponaria TaxID=32244 RepID=A0AAD7Q7A0_QUISA|nr:LETM1-like protein [Quillaja saponaria]